MNLFDTLKEFKKITPDADFVARSRREILLSPQHEPLAWRGVLTIFRTLETGAAFALAGLFILILTGTFSGPNAIAPIQPSVIDPTGLHAEAQAVDMQIQLANVNYPQVTSTVSGGPAIIVTPRTFSGKGLMKPLANTGSTSTATSTGAGASGSSTTSSTLSVDQALEQLSH